MRRDESLPLLAAAPILAILAWWTFAGGGYAPTVWYPGALALLGLLGVLAVSGALSLPRRRPLVLALAAFGAYTAWSFLSILWADSQGDAVEGSHRTLLYFLAFSVMALVRWTPTALMICVGAWVAIVVAAAAATTLSLGGSGALDQVIGARLSEPLGYMNANAALWTMAALPALVLGSRPQTPLVLRPLLIAAAALLIELSVLSQSRGWLFTLPLVLALALVIVPGRLRVGIFTLPVVAAIAVSGSDLLEPYNVGGGVATSTVAAPLREALNEAASSAWSGAGVALLAAALLVAADRFGVVPGAVRSASVPIGGAILAVVLVAGLGAGIAATDGRPVQKLERGWEEFKDFEGGDEAGRARFSRLGSSRYDFWRVSVDAWREHPVLGLGQDNFAEIYVQRRRSDEEPRWTHSLQLRLLAHTGLVGLVLMLVALGAIVVASGVLSRARPGRLVAALALLPAVDWFVHGSLDWLWEYPALTGAAFAFAGGAAGLGSRLARKVGERPPRPLSRRLRLSGSVAVLALGLVAAGWMGMAFLADRNRELGQRGFATDPELALERFGRARSLDPFDAQAPLLQGLAAAQLGRTDVARDALLEAIERSPRDWLAPFELGLLPGQPDARQRLETARRLNPSEPLIRRALRRLDAPRPMTQEEAAAAFRERIRRRFGG